jgi:hypothetical protein
MENAPQGKQKSGVSVFAALAGMLVTFLAGVFVGLHPTWIPIKTSSYPDVSQPVALPSSPTSPTTQPAESGS